MKKIRPERLFSKPLIGPWQNPVSSPYFKPFGSYWNDPVTCPEIGTTYSVWMNGSLPIMPQQKIWLSYLPNIHRDQITYSYEEDGVVHVARWADFQDCICYGTIQAFGEVDDAHNLEVFFLVDQVIMLKDIPEMFPVQPFPTELEERLDFNMMGMAYFGSASYREENGVYFMSHCAHTEGEHIMAVEYKGDIRIVLSDYYEEDKNDEITYVGHFDAPDWMKRNMRDPD
ncbi:MAG: hypothetical protein JO154_21955 [Chitinophaga sp.]|uniref:hypothetical protein n=1 Tax=Chitinophaga sp. TaxID=1869181 RepID=UPI0025C0BECB|nr:hypothetical protein [Chitinophaga sp.]MBV8255280.1 hypothetical protein [Chitinophaga sp.]